MTKAERVLWRAMRSALPDIHWRKQAPFGRYTVDFCAHSAKLIIEVDGGQHASATEHDSERTRFLEAEGYRVLRFWNDDVLSNTDGVLERIAEALATKASPLAGDARGSLVRGTGLRMSPGHPVLVHGGGRPASAGQENLCSAAQTADAVRSAPPPNPPHNGEGLKA